MKSRLKQEWNNRLHMALGYQIVEDEEQLKALNIEIRNIISIERAKWNKKQSRKSGSLGDL